MAYAPPPAKKLKLSTQINDLPDAELAEIFKRLPPYERLIASEVCRRWHALSRKAWLDIKTVDLLDIPRTAHVGAVVRPCACPNLQTVFAVKAGFKMNELACLSLLTSLSCVKLYACELQLDEDTTDVIQSDDDDDDECSTESEMSQSAATDIVQCIFSADFEHSSLTELVLHDNIFDADDETALQFVFTAILFPASLTHLQLSGLYMFEWLRGGGDRFLDGLERLENLECFILSSTPAHSEWPTDLINEALWCEEDIFEKICSLKNLKELCFSPTLQENVDLEHLVLSLPKLEVLFLNGLFSCDVVDKLAVLIQTHAVLRILALTGPFDVDDGDDSLEPIQLPARKRFAHGFGSSSSLPLLHIFVGKEASENVRFAGSSDAALVHPIDLPMPQFLEREDIAPIFKDVWLAAKIKEAAQHGSKLWDYERFDAATAVQHTNTTMSSVQLSSLNDYGLDAVLQYLPSHQFFACYSSPHLKNQQIHRCSLKVLRKLHSPFAANFKELPDFPEYPNFELQDRENQTLICAKASALFKQSPLIDSVEKFDVSLNQNGFEKNKLTQLVELVEPLTNNINSLTLSVMNAGKRKQKTSTYVTFRHFATAFRTLLPNIESFGIFAENILPSDHLLTLDFL